ncbi:hypothetical protein Tco_0412274 [Tanacetum coccineum]
MKVEESLNAKFNETPPPNSPPLVDDDLQEVDIIENQSKDFEVKENEPLNKQISNIKESKDHPLGTVIGNLNQRTLRSQVHLTKAYGNPGNSTVDIVYPRFLTTAGDYSTEKALVVYVPSYVVFSPPWSTRNKPPLSISTTEAEYVTAGKACQQALWMKQTL